MYPYDLPIFTLNARGNIILGVIREHFNLSDKTMHREINDLHLSIQQALASKGIPYAQLKSGLVPSADRNEAGFIFDSQCIEQPFYGLEIARAILSVLDPRTTQSILHGDLLGENQGLILDILKESLTLARPKMFVHGTLWYCVYLNNLSDAALKRLHEKLGEFPAYVGYISTTFSSPAKTYLSTTLSNAYLKNGHLVILGHEDDRPNIENVNTLNYPFEDFGYKVFSLQSSYFDLFLS